MSLAIKKKSKLMAKKRKLQREFVSQVRAEGLSASQAVERASIFPRRAKMKVVAWPNF